MLGRLRQLPDGQRQHGLLGHCLDACKVNHLLRTTHMSRGKAPVESFSGSLRKDASEGVGASFDARAWEQATLPIIHGGLGIRDPVTTREEARIAALTGLTVNAEGAVGVP